MINAILNLPIQITLTSARDLSNFECMFYSGLYHIWTKKSYIIVGLLFIKLANKCSIFASIHSISLAIRTKLRPCCYNCLCFVRKTALNSKNILCFFWTWVWWQKRKFNVGLLRLVPFWSMFFYFISRIWLNIRFLLFSICT